MTDKRIAQLREMYERDAYAGGHMLEALDAIVTLKAERDTLNRALVKQTKIAAKLREAAR